MIQSVIFPLQQFLDRSFCSLVEADDWPQTAAYGTAATQAAAEKPLHVDGQVLLQASVHSADAGFELLWGDLSR